MEFEASEEKLNPKDYWKCSECGKVVEIDFDVCWNCQNNKPEEIENPSFDELLKYKTNDRNRLDSVILLRCPICGETGIGKIGSCWNCGHVPT